MNTIKTLFTALLMGCFLFCLAQTTDLNGKWKGNIQLPDGNVYPVTYVFKITAGQLTGTAQAEGDPKPLTGTKTDGTVFSFSIADDNGGSISHEGKYHAQGDSISITVNYQGDKLHGTLKRAQ